MIVALVAITAIGLLASVSPTTLVVFALLLVTVRPTGNAVGFLVGWTLSLVVVFSAVYLASGIASNPHSGAHTASSAAEIALGVVFAVVAARVWRRRQRPRSPSARMTRLQARLKRLRPWQAAALGIAKQPWMLTAAAALILVHHKIGPLTTALAFLLFTASSTAVVLAVFGYYVRDPGETHARLDEWQVRLTRAGTMLVVGASVVVSAFLLADGIIGLVGS